MASSKSVWRSYKYRFYPTNVQEVQLSRTFGCVRLVWNMALDERNSAYTNERRRITYNQASATLTKWKRTEEFSFLNEVSSVPLQQALRHQQSAFNNFFEKRSRYPKFKSRKKSRASATYTRMGFRWRDGQLWIAKMEAPLDIRWSRPLPESAELTSVTISRDSAGRWFVSISVVEPIKPLRKTGRCIGVDVGIASLATLSTGEKIANPRHEMSDHRKLAKAQRELARKQKGSKNRDKARLKVARAHTRIADRRNDFLHKLSTRLIRENQAVAIEDLTVRNMLANRCLARAIADASWFQFRAMLEYKADWFGREVLVVSRWFPSSKLCSDCGALRESLSLGVRQWDCACGAVHDRDVNAAKNILAAGLAER